MKSLGLSLLLITAVVLVGWFVIKPWLASGSTTVELVPMKYLCTETQEVFDLPAQPEPAVNPKTGRRTLVRAVRSPDRKSWVPAPQDEVLQRQRQRRPQSQPSPATSPSGRTPDF